MKTGVSGSAKIIPLPQHKSMSKASSVPAKDASFLIWVSVSKLDAAAFKGVENAEQVHMVETISVGLKWGRILDAEKTA